MPGEPVEQFVETVRMTRSPMKDVVFENHIQTMSVAVRGIAKETLRAHKQEILDDCPFLIRAPLRLCWYFVEDIFIYVEAAVVVGLFRSASRMTIEDVAEIMFRCKDR